MGVSSVWSWVNHDIAIDLGTANTLLYLQGQGIVLDEPSVIVMDDGKKQNEPLAVGLEAKEMLGRTPRELRVVHPMQRGVIADFSATQMMLKCFMSRAIPQRRLGGAHVIVSIPAMATSVEVRAFRDVVRGLPGVRSVSIVPDTLAGAHGVGLPVEEPTGCMLVDIGAGTTAASVLSSGGIVVTRSMPVGGNAMDERIIQLIRNRWSILIGERTAEDLKIRVGAAKLDGEELTRMVTGYDLTTGLPGTIAVRTSDILDAISGVVNIICDLVCRVLELTPPELSADLLDRGVVMTGGGALLRGFDEVMSERLGVPVSVATEPFKAVACGAAEMMKVPQPTFETEYRAMRTVEI